MKRGKRYRELLSKLDKRREYSLQEGIRKIKETASAKFDESVEVAVRLGIDPRKSDQVIRGTVRLPHGVGKEVKVLVLTKGDKEDEAKEAGADYVGLGEYIEKIKSGWAEVDVIIATPDVMSEVGKLGKILGPKGLMPNPKSGTVTFDLKKAVKEVKAGKIEFRTDRSGVLHAGIGKVSFDEEKLLENAKAFLDAVIKAKPPAAKGQYIKSITLSNTMGPGIKINRSTIMDELQ